MIKSRVVDVEVVGIIATWSLVLLAGSSSGAIGRAADITSCNFVFIGLRANIPLVIIDDSCYWQCPYVGIVCRQRFSSLLFNPSQVVFCF